MNRSEKAFAKPQWLSPETTKVACGDRVTGIALIGRPACCKVGTPGGPAKAGLVLNAVVIVVAMLRLSLGGGVI